MTNLGCGKLPSGTGWLDADTREAKAARNDSPVRDLCVIFNVMVSIIPECGVEGHRGSSRPQGTCRTGLRPVAGWPRFEIERFPRGKAVAGLPALHSSLLCRLGNGRCTPLLKRARLRRIQVAHD